MAAGRMRLVRWNPLRKGTLRGLATVELPIGLEIVDCPVLTSYGTAWVMLSGKPQIDQDGCQRRDGAGEPLYVAMLNSCNRALREAFSNRVELVRQTCPGDLAEAAE